MHHYPSIYFWAFYFGGNHLERTTGCITIYGMLFLVQSHAQMRSGPVPNGFRTCPKCIGAVWQLLGLSGLKPQQLLDLVNSKPSNCWVEFKTVLQQMLGLSALKLPVLLYLSGISLVCNISSGQSFRFMC